MLQRLLSLLGIYGIYEKWLWFQVRNGMKPEHVAIILDGNRRWAFGKSLIPWLGHRHGANKIDDLMDWCIALDVKSITLYAFSTENFLRPKKEVEELMRLIEEKLLSTLENKRIHENRIRVKAIGRLDLLPKSTQEIIQRVEESTRMYNDRFLNVALAYGGRAEIVDAAKKIATEVENGELNSENIDEELFEKYLYTAHMPKQSRCDPSPLESPGNDLITQFLSIVSKTDSHRLPVQRKSLLRE